MDEKEKRIKSRVLELCHAQNTKVLVKSLTQDMNKVLEFQFSDYLGAKLFIETNLFENGLHVKSALILSKFLHCTFQYGPVIKLPLHISHSNMAQ